MEPAPRPSFDPVWAGALLVAGVALGIGLGALIGWGVGHVAYGVLGGAVVGVPLGVVGVYWQYRGAFS
jgi:hypothetical protein